jgi:hypothetical protein
MAGPRSIEASAAQLATDPDDLGSGLLVYATAEGELRYTAQFDDVIDPAATGAATQKSPRRPVRL